MRRGRFPHQRLGRRSSGRGPRAGRVGAGGDRHRRPARPAARPALSGGQRQRAWIAMALAQDTPILLLDEPTTYLDLAHQLEVLDLLADLNAAGPDDRDRPARPQPRLPLRAPPGRAARRRRPRRRAAGGDRRRGARPRRLRPALARASPTRSPGRRCACRSGVRRLPRRRCGTRRASRRRRRPRVGQPLDEVEAPAAARRARVGGGDRRRCPRRGPDAQTPSARTRRSARSGPRRAGRRC